MQENNTMTTFAASVDPAHLDTVPRPQLDCIRIFISIFNFQPRMGGCYYWLGVTLNKNKNSNHTIQLIFICFYNGQNKKNHKIVFNPLESFLRLLTNRDCIMINWTHHCPPFNKKTWHKHTCEEQLVFYKTFKMFRDHFVLSFIH